MQISKDVLDALRHDDYSRKNNIGEKFTITGTVTSFYPDLGHGFIEPDNSDIPDVYLTITSLTASGYRAPNAGARIECEVIHGFNRLSVMRVFKLENRKNSLISS